MIRPSRFMLTLYRRHRKDCPHTDRFLRQDAKRCPLWVEGMVNGIYHRHSLKVSSWEKGEKLRRELEDGRPPQSATLEFAFAAFLGDLKARNLAESTQRKHKVLIEKLRKFCAERGLTTFPELDINQLRDFRASWKFSPISALKNLERLRSWFTFCIESGWTATNPARILKNPVISDPPTLPFDDAEIPAILAHARGKWRVLVLVLLHSGLRIGDAMKLTPNEVKDGKIFLYMQKTRVPVYVPAPEFLVHELRRLPVEGGYYFWRKAGPNSKLDTATGNARRAFRRICKDAGVSGGHPHRLRDTFAVRLLLAGVPIEDVSILLGHSSVKITEGAYAPWVQARQTRLEEMVRRTWNPQLIRVK